MNCMMASSPQLRAPIVEPEDSLVQTEASLVGDLDGVEEEEKVTINVGGIYHDTLLSTLASKPDTRLGYMAKRHVKGRKENYFYDRHPGVFSTVIDYYRSGELHVPLDVCGAVVKRELDFWQIEDCLIEPCCWISYSSYIDNEKTLSDFNQSVAQENEEMSAVNSLTGWPHKKMKIWMTLDHPRSSRLAMIYAVTSFLFVLTSITGFCLETLDKHPPANMTAACDGNNTTWEPETNFLSYLDYICTSFFSIELATRIVFAPNKLMFFRSVMNIIDIIALLPLYVEIILTTTDTENCLQSHVAVIEIIFILRIIRIFRIFHLVKHYKALMILVHAIRASVQELLMLSIFLFIAMLVFSTLIFYAERDSRTEDQRTVWTIPVGFWWSIITMTTVGYGDVSPKTPFGCVVGGLCAVCGVLLVALTIPVISNNFALFYLHARTREQIATKEERSGSMAEDLESLRTKCKMGSNSSQRKKGMDSKSLLMNADSSSTTDESGIMMTNVTSGGASRQAEEPPGGGCGGAAHTVCGRTMNKMNETSM